MTEREVIKLFRFVNGYDNLEQLEEATGVSKRAFNDKRGAYLSNRVLQALADSFDVTYQALVLSFRLLQDLEYENKKDRKKALMYIMSLDRDKE